MKNFSLLIIACCLILSCSKEKQSNVACNSSDPVNEVSWMKEMKASLTNCSCEMSIIQGTYQGKTVFFIAMTDALCNGISSAALFDCKGVLVKSFSAAEYADFNNTVTRDKVLYRCKTSK
jgi:hypothetical protein